MGYYTEYDLRILNGDQIEFHKDQIETELDYYVFQDSAKWYDHEDYMLEYSKRYPELVFELHGIGEEFVDIWKTYFKNGSLYTIHARIVFDDFDETKLEIKK